MISYSNSSPWGALKRRSAVVIVNLTGQWCDLSGKDNATCVAGGRRRLDRMRALLLHVLPALPGQPALAATLLFPGAAALVLLRMFCPQHRAGGGAEAPQLSTY
jgi:hypothetical protein